MCEESWQRKGKPHERKWCRNLTNDSRWRYRVRFNHLRDFKMQIHPQFISRSILNYSITLLCNYTSPFTVDKIIDFSHLLKLTSSDFALNTTHADVPWAHQHAASSLCTSAPTSIHWCLWFTDPNITGKPLYKSVIEAMLALILLSDKALYQAYTSVRSISSAS